MKFIHWTLAGLGSGREADKVCDCFCTHITSEEVRCCLEQAAQAPGREVEEGGGGAPLGGGRLRPLGSLGRTSPGGLHQTVLLGLGEVSKQSSHSHNGLVLSN